MPLTDTAIRKAKAGDKTFKLFDERGLFLLVTPAGGKWWRLKYRCNGKEKQISLGIYPDVGLKAARERRDEARKQVAVGIDPSAHRKAQKSSKAVSAANTFEIVAREWFEKYSPSWAPNHGPRVIRRLERDVFPHLGKRPIAEITAPELLGVIRRITMQCGHRYR
jgi:hypothetical protein